MSKPFSLLAGILLLFVAAVHLYRLTAHLGVTVGSHDIPLWVSWPGALVAGLLGVMVLVESRR